MAVCEICSAASCLPWWTAVLILLKLPCPLLLSFLGCLIFVWFWSLVSFICVSLVIPYSPLFCLRSFIIYFRYLYGACYLTFRWHDQRTARFQLGHGPWAWQPALWLMFLFGLHVRWLQLDWQLYYCVEDLSRNIKLQYVNTIIIISLCCFYEIFRNIKPCLTNNTTRSSVNEPGCRPCLYDRYILCRLSTQL